MKFYLGGNDGKFSYTEYLKRVPEYDRGAFDLWPKTCKIVNARLKQDSYESPAAFFKEHGFCLLNSPTKVKDWNDDYDKKVCDITEIYNPECEAMLRNDVFPTADYGEIIDMHMLNIVLRRGRGTKRTGYIPVVHQDFGRGRDAFIHNLNAYGAKIQPDGKNGWPARFDREEVKNYMMLNFWRPTNMEK